MREEIQIVKVRYLHAVSTQRPYSFKSNLTRTLEVGDVIVVDASTSYCLCEVTEVLGDDAVASKWVVDYVDVSSHQERMELRKRINEVRCKMEIRRQKLADIEVYEVLAEKDDSMKTLLDEYKHLLARRGTEIF